MDVAEEDNAQISKRQAIQAIMKDSSLTPQERQKQIQAFMAGGGQTEETSKPLPPSTDDVKPATSRQVQMKAIMQDKSLTPQEKQKRIQGIMASSKAAAAAASADTPRSPRPAQVGASVSSVDPAARKIKRESVRNLDSSQHTMTNSSGHQATPNSPRASAVGASSAATVDPASRKIQRDSMRSLQAASTTDATAAAAAALAASSVAAATSNSVAAAAASDAMVAAATQSSETPAPTTSRQELMKKIMQDKALTPQEKQKRIQEIMSSAGSSSSSSASNQPPSAPPADIPRSPRPSAVGATVSMDTVDPAARKLKRESLRNLNSTRSLQVDGSAASSEVAAADTTPAPITSKQAMMKAVMQDKSLTPQEKQQRIQEIMAGGVGVGVAADNDDEAASAPAATMDPAARKIQRDSMRSLNAASNTDAVASAAAAIAASSVATATANSVAATAASSSMAAAAGAPVTADPAARKLQRESMRNLNSTRSSQSTRSLRSSAHTPSSLPDVEEAAPAPTTSKQAMMQAVMQDSSLSPQEKQQRIQEIVAGGMGAGVAAAAASSEPEQGLMIPSQGHEFASSATEGNDDMPYSEDAQARGSNADFIGEEEGGIEAFVPDQEQGNAVAALDIYTQDELEEEEENRKRRMLWLGGVVFCVLIIAVVVTVLSLAPEDEPIGEVIETSESPTGVPSSAPTPAAILELLAELEGRYPNPEMYEAAFNDVNTPQYQALLWATNEGNPDNLEGAHPRMINRYALATFYFATNGNAWARCSKDGTNCEEGGSWLLAADECGWLAITCDANTQDVTQIFFQPTGAVNENNVGGTLPYEVSLLQSLTRITISNNAIGGSIPDSWSGSLSTLEALVLGNNDLTGSLPSSLISNNPNLRQIRLNDNQLSQLPESATNGALTLLNLQNNNLMGPIPPGLSGLSALQTLDLRQNSLNDTVPEELLGVTSLRNLYLSENMLVGSVSTGLESLTNLRRLELNDNSLTGSISDGLCLLKTSGDLAYLSVDCEEVACGCCDNCV